MKHQAVRVDDRRYWTCNSVWSGALKGLKKGDKLAIKRDAGLKDEHIVWNAGELAEITDDYIWLHTKTATIGYPFSSLIEVVSI